MESDVVQKSARGRSYAYINPNRMQNSPEVENVEFSVEQNDLPT